MGDTPISWLSDLNAKYTPSSTQFDAARGHRASIESRLDSDLGEREMFEIGSLRHGTGVWIYSDADYLVSLKGIRPESIWTMLEKVKSSLETRFPSTTISTRRPAVVCESVRILGQLGMEARLPPRGFLARLACAVVVADTPAMLTEHLNAAARGVRPVGQWL